MRRLQFAIAFGVLAAGLAAVGYGLRAAPEGPQLDPEKIGAAAATKATAKDGVVRLAWARADVPVTVDGMPLKPFAGLGSWAGFTGAPHGGLGIGGTGVF